MAEAHDANNGYNANAHFRFITYCVRKLRINGLTDDIRVYENKERFPRSLVEDTVVHTLYSDCALKKINYVNT